jgi:hypothetical protein
VGWKNGKRSVARQDATSLGSHKPLARSEGLIVEELGDEVLVYDSKVDVAHCLSPDAARVWRQCDGEASVETLTAHAGLSAERAEDALDELQRCNLLEQPPTLAGDGHTRRELSLKVAKVGAAAAAVPLIVSVSAPTPAQAGTLRFCATFSSGNCGTSSGCTGTVGCCCCTPVISSPFPAGSPCAEFAPNAPQCKTCVPCQQQTACQQLYTHNGNGCGNEHTCPK